VLACLPDPNLPLFLILVLSAILFLRVFIFKAMFFSGKLGAGMHMMYMIIYAACMLMS